MSFANSSKSSFSEKFEALVHSAVWAALIGAFGNFSIQYNYTALSPALAIMSPEVGTKEFPKPPWVDKVLPGVVFAGSLIGMCFMGYLGDLLGRRVGLLITLSFVVFGAFASSIFSRGSPETIYLVIGIMRFIMGIGIGGIYPMSAAIAAEAENKKKKDDCIHAQAVKAGKAFFWRTPGAMATYILAWVMQAAQPSGQAELQFRLLLGLGVIPATLAMILTWLSVDKTRKEQPEDKAVKVKEPSPWELAKANPQYWVTLIGTGGTWLLFDVAYYGTFIFQPDIIASIFGSKATPAEICWRSLIVTAMGMPGIITAVIMTRRKGARWLNIWGFNLMALLYLILAVCFMIKPEGLAGFKFFILALLTFAFNFGPNVATYVLPAQVFPVEVRTTFHGLSSALGKVGAVIGTFLFKPIQNSFGIASVMWVQVVLCLLGTLVSIYFIDKDAVEKIRKLEQDRDEEARLAAMENAEVTDGPESLTSPLLSN